MSEALDALKEKETELWAGVRGRRGRPVEAAVFSPHTGHRARLHFSPV